MSVPAFSAEISDDALVENTQLQVVDGDPVGEDATDQAAPSDESADAGEEADEDAVGEDTTDTDAAAVPDGADANQSDDQELDALNYQGEADAVAGTADEGDERDPWTSPSPRAPRGCRG